MFSDKVVPRLDLFEGSLANFNSKSIFKRFLDYFPMHFREKNAQITGEKAVENGAEMVINAAQILLFVVLSTRMILYKLPSLKHYFANEIGDFGAGKFNQKHHARDG